jgi:hypothetical protein
MASVEIPNFGALLGKFIGAISPAGRPAFLAGLEREAAARYRGWAEAAPGESGGLLACAAREDEIADRIEARFAMSEADRAAAEKNLPEARKLYSEVFEGLTLRDQLTIQANAERQGAQAWRGILDGAQDEAIREVLRGCAALEEETADYLDTLLANPSAKLDD